MKTLKLWILKLWFLIFPKKEIAAINQKLEKAVVNKSKNRLILLTEIKKYILNDLKIDYNSKFIPLSVRRAAVTKVQKKFGEQMKDLNVIININLKLILK